MEVKTILDKNTIQTRLSARTKADALQELANILLANNYISDVEGFLKDVYVREAQGQTGIGNFVAIPHGKSKYVDKIGVAIGITDEEISWESLDGKGVKVIILFAVGDDVQAAKEHLKLLSIFARKLGNDEIINRLLKAVETDDVINALEL